MTAESSSEGDLKAGLCTDLAPWPQNDAHIHTLVLPGR